MFTLTLSHTYDWPVTVSVPCDGRHQDHTFTATFKVIPQDRWDTLVASPDAGTDPAVIRETLVGWSDVYDEDGQPLPFTPQSVHEALQVPYLRTALVRAYLDSLRGATEKN